MNVGIISTLNAKGQIVLPVAFRKARNLLAGTQVYVTLTKSGISIQPIVSVVTEPHEQEVYKDVVARTKGSWKADTTKSLDAKRARELKDASERKHAW